LQGDRASVLDIGCGLGSFYEHLTGAGIHCEYTGYDIVPEYVECCRERFPECRFELRNFFDQGIAGEFDTIVMSQALNNRYEHSDNVRVVQAALRAAFASTRISVSVDLLSSYVDFHAPDLFYYSPEEIFGFAKTLTRRVVLRHDYRPFEFCVQLFHESADGYVA
jgi:SAM-dependent methyltransferase